jgi:hypothetical protein
MEAQTKALQQILQATKPGQSLDISEAIDLICEVYNLALAALEDRQEA